MVNIATPSLMPMNAFVWFFFDSSLTVAEPNIL